MSLHNIAAVVALLVLLPCYAQATNYTVGDTQQWNLNVNYTTWVTGKNFNVGDFLVFIYSSSEHNVLEVSKSAHDSCQTSNPTRTYTQPPTSIPLSSAGSRYFICGVTGHCALGMKLAVNVAAAANSPSPSTNSPSPSTNSPAPTTNSPSPSTNSPAPTTNSPSPTTNSPGNTPPTAASPSPTENAAPASTIAAGYVVVLLVMSAILV